MALKKLISIFCLILHFTILNGIKLTDHKDLCKCNGVDENVKGRSFYGNFPKSDELRSVGFLLSKTLFKNSTPNEKGEFLRDNDYHYQVGFSIISNQ